MASSDNKEAVKGVSIIVTTRGLASTLTAGYLLRKSSTIASQPTSRSVSSVKASGNPVEEQIKVSVISEVHNSLIYLCKLWGIIIWFGRVMGLLVPGKGS